MEYGLVVLWLVAYAVLTAISLPIASVLFERFPGHGATFALPISLAVMTLVAYWIGHLAFGWFTAVIAVCILLVLSALAFRAGGTIHPRAFLGAMTVFALAFLFMVAIRAVDPAVHPAGGEKFLDFGLLKTVLRADRFPPEDFWFAGKTLRYYYGGFLMTDILSMLTRTPLRYAYNLALAGFYATLLTVAYGLAGAIADTHGKSVRAAGVCAVFFVGIAGNIVTPARMVLGFVPKKLAAQYGHVFLSAIRGVPSEQLIGTVTTPEGFSYWYARYVIDGTIDVFPLWSFLNGDLNAFMIAMTFLVGCAALSFAYYRTPESELARRRALVFAAFPPAAGLCALISTWSFPSAIGLCWLSLTFADARPATLLPPSLSRYVPIPTDATTVRVRLRDEVSRTVVAAVLAIAAGVLGAAWASPFLLFNKPVVRGVVLFPPRSGLIQLFLVHGAFLVVFALYLLARRPPWLRERVSNSRTRTLAVVGVV
ncbi:MAG TPA: DUF2298 domain-containing protein, partial [Halococcus sp.]|nr:DUF2298 domain-containing protein [Halococcus sp.]